MANEVPSFDEFLKSGEYPTYNAAVIAHAAAMAIEEVAQSVEQPSA